MTPLETWPSSTGPDRATQTRIRERVLAAFEAEMALRLDTGRPKLDRTSSEAFALDVVGRELHVIDCERLGRNESRLTPLDEKQISDQVIATVLGLGPVEMILADESVEEILASRWNIIYVYRSDGTVERLRTPLFRSEAQMVAWLAHLARTAGRTERQFNAQRPLLVMRIGESLRLAAHCEVSQNVGFALRRNTLGHVTLDDLERLDMMAPPLIAMLRAIMRDQKMRVVFAGPTGSGKSTLARACLNELEPQVHIVVIEDTAELDLFDEVDHPRVDSWEAREANAEGEGTISMTELVEHSLRVRPDWLVCGEVRSADSSVPMVKAMTHGLASMTTVHSPDAVGALEKLAVYLGTGVDRLPVSFAHHQLSMAVDFVFHLDRMPDGHRYVTEVIEVEGFDGSRCTTNTVYRHELGFAPIGTPSMTDRRKRQLARAGFDTASLLNAGARS